MSSESDVASCMESILRVTSYTPEDAELLKTALLELTSQLASQAQGSAESEKRLACRFSIKNPHLFDHLTFLLENFPDAKATAVICAFFHACLGPAKSADGQAIVVATLVDLRLTEVLFKQLQFYSQTSLSSLDPCVHSAYQVLAKLASKDAKFPVKARLVGGLHLTHQLLQHHMKNYALLQPILMVTKFLVKNSTNQVALGKEGCLSTILTILASIPKTHWLKIKYVVEILAYLTRTKSNVASLVRESGIQRILSILHGWDKIERRHQVNILKSVLSILSHLCDSRNGQKALAALGGVDLIQHFLLCCPSEKKFDIIFNTATNVFLKTCSQQQLPGVSTQAAVSYKTPLIESFSNRTEKAVPEPDASEEEADTGIDLEEEDDSVISKLFNLSVEECAQQPVQELDKFACFFPELRGDSESVVENSQLINERECHQELFRRTAAETMSLVNFVKLAYPDLVGAVGPSFLEPLSEKDRTISRRKAFLSVERALNATSNGHRVVYDLDFLLSREQDQQLFDSGGKKEKLTNWDEKRIGKKDVSVNHLHFESRFEGGNLRRVIQVGEHEYDLILNADVNSHQHHQWFYFEVTNMKRGVPYIFNIINNEKENSEFNSGMKPVVFSVKQALLGEPYWTRVGSDICYYRNHYKCLHKNSDDRASRNGNKSYYTVTFTISFPHSYDVCYLAYHYPYTYSQLQTYLAKKSASELPQDAFYCNQVLCRTLNGNPLPLLSITSRGSNEAKQMIFLTGRVHPGESNTSWMMKSTVDFLLGKSPEASSLRNKYIFKIVPMLNPEGVIHGNQRCGLTGEDLNRRWRNPDLHRHPTIHSIKALISFALTAGYRIRAFCDFHGHSRQKNIFMYGCSRQQSWWPSDKDLMDDPNLMMLPLLAQNCIPAFSLRDCKFQVERARESTARVTIWRQFGIAMSYTVEASMCGCDQGIYKNYHLSTSQLIEAGRGFCVALASLDGHQAAIGLSAADRYALRSILQYELEKDEDRPTGASQEDSLGSEEELDYELYGYT